MVIYSNVVDEWFVRDEDAQESGETWYTCVFGRHTQMLIVATRLKVYCLDLKVYIYIMFLFFPVKCLTFPFYST